MFENFQYTSFSLAGINIGIQLHWRLACPVCTFCLLRNTSSVYQPHQPKGASPLRPRHTFLSLPQKSTQKKASQKNAPSHKTFPPPLFWQPARSNFLPLFPSFEAVFRLWILDTKSTAAVNRQKSQENIKLPAHCPAHPRLAVRTRFSALRSFIAGFDLLIAKFKQALKLIEYEIEILFSDI